ncbi:MAG: hypothetical protein IJ699_04485 [Bacteroidaceae bacterium]|nr:hypothetical protein [Bacteroidaceae bacterium]
MKRTYTIPDMKVVQVQHETFIAISGVKSNSNDINIGYGGVDDNGELDPEVKGNSFDFEWE